MVHAWCVDTGRESPKLGCQFYRTDTGAQPVREWLLGLAHEVRVQIGSDIGKGRRHEEAEYREQPRVAV
jgi:hypothetical protein